MASKRSKRRKTPTENEPATQSITMRLETSLVAEIDMEARREEESGIKLTRTNIVRLLLTEALKRRADQRQSQNS